MPHTPAEPPQANDPRRVPATNLSYGPVYTAKEQVALDTIVAMGITLDPNPLPRPTDGMHTMCAFHLLDANGEDLDGGQASSLLSYINAGYITDAATIRPVSR